MLPDKFKCVVTTWDYMYKLCKDVAEQVKDSSFQPDTIVALARGGWFAGRVLCDLLGLDDLTSLKVEHYVGTAAQKDEAEVRYPLPDGAVTGKNVLIVDDIADTGKSIALAKEYVLAKEPAEVKTATLQLLYTSKIEPDYYGEYLEDWAWVIFPWNFVEDMIDLVSRLMSKEKKELWSVKDIKSGLYRYHSLDPVFLEVAQPNRMKEILEEMEKRKKVKRVVKEGKIFWKPVE
jgi:hypothetical protein